MNILLWTLQILLALHTFTGAVWKFSHSEQTVDSLKSLPHYLWTALSILEILCALCLILPLINRRLGILAPLAAACISTEMLLFCGLHLSSGAADHSPMYYWLIVAAISMFIAWGRFVFKPIIEMPKN